MNIEQIILGTLLREPHLVAKVDISAADFADQWHAVVFQAMRATVAAGLEIDAYGIAERIGGPSALADVDALRREAWGAPENLPHYVDQLRKTARGRKLKATLQAALAETGDCDSVRAGLITQLAGLDSAEQRHDLTARQLMERVVDHIATMQERGSAGIPTGLGKIDREFGGFHPTDLIVIAGRPGAGKTAFGVGVGMHAAQQGLRVGIISTEMDGTQLGARMVTALSGISSAVIRTGQLHDRDYARLTAASTAVAALGIRVNDKPVMTVADCALQARSWALSGGLDLLVVDYLQRLQPEGRTENRTLEVGKMAVGLKNLAKTLKIPVVALAQLNRASVTRTDKRPNMGDLRDSGMIEQEADMVLLLHRADGLSTVIVDKNRHGECLDIICQYEPTTMRWSADDQTAASAWA
jgi:replicative DNA helicase